MSYMFFAVIRASNAYSDRTLQADILQRLSSLPGLCCKPDDDPFLFEMASAAGVNLTGAFCIYFTADPNDNTSHSFFSHSALGIVFRESLYEIGAAAKLIIDEFGDRIASLDVLVIDASPTADDFERVDVGRDEFMKPLAIALNNIVGIGERYVSTRISMRF